MHLVCSIVLLHGGPMLLVQVMLELARLYLTLDEVDACQDQCSVILKNDQFNEDATLVCFSAAFASFFPSWTFVSDVILRSVLR